MEHSDFFIGMEFLTDTLLWRCTDVGTRTVIAINISHVNVVRQADDGHVVSEQVDNDMSWFNGPPYAVAEQVFDEHDMPSCRPQTKK